MKALLFTLLVYVISIQSLAQTPTPGTPTEEEYITIMNGLFRTLVTNSNGTTPGAFAGLNMAEGKASFSPAYQLANGDILSGKINAGLTEGLAYLFKRELNTNVSLGIEYNHIPNWNLKFLGLTRYIDTDVDQVTSYHKEKDNVKLQFRADSLKIVSGSSLFERRANLCQKIIGHEQCFDSNCPEKDSLFRRTKDIILSEMATIDSILCDSNRFAEWKDTQLALAKSKRKEALNQLGLDKIEIEEFQLIWFTAGAQVKRDAFKRFDPMLDFANRLIDETYTSHQLYGKISLYKRRLAGNPRKLRTANYFSFGFLYDSKSNFQELNPVEITIQDDYGSNSTSSMFSSKKYTAYEGEYKKNIDELTINFDSYNFTTTSFAIHTYFTYRMCEGIRPELNPGIGLLFPFISSKDDKSILNVEVFYTQFNVWRTIKDDLKIADQGRLGLRFTFPIDFN